MSVAPADGGRNRLMIYGPKNDGTYVVEFKTPMARRWRSACRLERPACSSRRSGEPVTRPLCWMGGPVALVRFSMGSQDPARVTSLSLGRGSHWRTPGAAEDFGTFAFTRALRSQGRLVYATGGKR
jgi:hypothetical protein